MLPFPDPRRPCLHDLTLLLHVCHRTRSAYTHGIPKLTVSIQSRFLPAFRPAFAKVNSWEHRADCVTCSPRQWPQIPIQSTISSKLHVSIAKSFSVTCTTHTPGQCFPSVPNCQVTHYTVGLELQILAGWGQSARTGRYSCWAPGSKPTGNRWRRPGAEDG